MNIKPINNNIIVEPIEKTGKLIVVDNEIELKGKVLSSANKDIRVGTIIHFKNSYDEITLSGKRLLIVNSDNVLAFE